MQIVTCFFRLGYIRPQPVIAGFAITQVLAQFDAWAVCRKPVSNPFKLCYVCESLTHSICRLRYNNVNEFLIDIASEND